MFQIKIQSYKNDFEIEGVVDGDIMGLLVKAFRDTSGVFFTMEESGDEWLRHALPEQLVAESLLSYKEVE